ncbi:MAG TPA: Ig domain-containing protein [Blastocatellia bacterium]|nr:Ig domain-containing protein [Blastocatellia bacterium]
MKTTLNTVIAVAFLAALLFGSSIQTYSQAAKTDQAAQHPDLQSIRNNTLAIKGDDPLQKISVTVKNNRLNFTTRADYERAVNESNPDVRAQVFERLKTLKGFTSLAATTPTTERTAGGRANASALITDDHFRSILNPDLVVQIGDYIVKVNPATEKVYALPAAHEAEYSDLVAERTSNPNIRQFSTGDAVLDMLASGQASARCQESGVGPQESQDTIRLGADAITVAVEYNRWGVFFSLRALPIIHPRLNATATVDLAPVYYHIRCGNTVGPYSVTGYDLGKNGIYHSWQGSTPLNELYMRARFQGKLTNVLNATFTNNSRWIEIRVNYTSPLPPDGLDYPHNPTACIVGQRCLFRPTLARGPATSWSITPALPLGLAIDSTTGVIDGVPKTTAPAVDRTVTAANAYGSTTKLLRMAVNLPTAPSNLTYPVNPAIYVMNQDVATNQPTHSGGTVTSWSVTPDLPPGLNLETDGHIWGRPTTAQAPKNYTITAQNAGGSTTATLTIEVRDPSTVLSGLTYSENPATYVVGTQIPTNKPTLATGVPWSGFTVTPTLPDGLTLSPTTGEIRGTPTQSQPTKTYTVNARGSTAQVGAFVQLKITIVVQSQNPH